MLAEIIPLRPWLDDHQRIIDQLPEKSRPAYTAFLRHFCGDAALESCPKCSSGTEEGQHFRLCPEGLSLWAEWIAALPKEARPFFSRLVRALPVRRRRT